MRVPPMGWPGVFVQISVQSRLMVNVFVTCISIDWFCVDSYLSLMNGETLYSPWDSPQVLEQHSANDGYLVNTAEWLCAGPESAGDPQIHDKAAPLQSLSLSPPIQGAI